MNKPFSHGHYFWRCFFVVAMSYMATFSAAEEVPTKTRPTIALVLSGGGAKGAAHVGVLKVLEEMRVPVDLVVGTSIGSVVGGLYALGYDANDIEIKMLNANFSQGYSDKIPRPMMPYRQKMYSDQFNIPLELGLENGKVELPAGALQGQTMQVMLSKMVGIVPQMKSFDDFPTPYRAVATDLSTRDIVVLDHGSIVTAMRASSSVPGALAPVEYRKKLLVDGGIASNISISVARSLGADIIIAVDIAGQLQNADQIRSGLEVVGVINQLSSFLTRDGIVKELATLQAQDILINPDIQQFEMTDFSIMPQALLAGEVATKKHIPALKALALPKDEYEQYQHEKNRKRKQLIPKKVVIRDIDLNNRSRVHSEYIKQELQLNKEQKVSINDINESVKRVYATNEFQKVEMRLLTAEGDNHQLHLTTREKSWGPNFLGFGFGWEEDLKGDTAFNFDTAFTMTNLSNYGAQWRNRFELGEDRSFHTDFYAPLTANRIFYSRLGYDYDTQTINLFLNNLQLTSYEIIENRVFSGLGVNFNHNSYFELGLKGADGDVKGSLLGRKIDYHNSGGYAILAYDSLDNVTFPTEGTAFVLGIDRRFEILHYPQKLHVESTTVDARWQGVLSLGHQAIIAKMHYARVFSEKLESIYIQRIGGFLELSGFHKNELSGNQKGLTAFVYQWDLGRSMLGMSQYPLYLGVSVEKGGAISSEQQMRWTEMVSAGSIFIGTDTAIGPAAFGFGATEDGNKAIYFFIGRNF